MTVGVVRGPPTAPVELVAGKSYWIALASAASTSLDGVQLYQIANSSTVVYRTPEMPFPDELTTGLTKDQGPDFNFFLFVRAIRP